MLSTSSEPLVLVAPTLTEIDDWIRKRLTAAIWSAFLEAIAAGAYLVAELEPTELARGRELERRYANINLGFVDVAVITICERLGEEKVATLEQGQFSTVRPAHCRSLRLLPAAQ